MMFASKNFTDPKPWAYALLGGDPKTWVREDSQLTGGFVYLPRTGINPQNWLLKMFREGRDTDNLWGNSPERAQLWVDNIITFAYEYGVENIEEVNHAHRVLSRLARMEERHESN